MPAWYMDERRRESQDATRKSADNKGVQCTVPDWSKSGVDITYSHCSYCLAGSRVKNVFEIQNSWWEPLFGTKNQFSLIPLAALKWKKKLFFGHYFWSTHRKYFCWKKSFSLSIGRHLTLERNIFNVHRYSIAHEMRHLNYHCKRGMYFPFTSIFYHHMPLVDISFAVVNGMHTVLYTCLHSMMKAFMPPPREPATNRN